MEETLLPRICRVADIIEETSDVRTLRLEFVEADDRGALIFKPGQFCLISVFGEGEAAFCIASSPIIKSYFEVTVKRLGKVTRAIHDLEVGDILGFRGPYGNSFPLEDLKGRDIVIAGGGIGIAPLRPVIYRLLCRARQVRQPAYPLWHPGRFGLPLRTRFQGVAKEGRHRGRNHRGPRWRG